MIREMHLRSITPVAAALAAQGVALAARENTPLSQLMARSFPYDQSQVGQDLESTLLSATALMTDEGAEGHSLVVDQIVATVSEAITNHAKFARNVVLPIVGNVYAQVREQVEEVGPIPYSVEQVWLHEAVTSPLLHQLLERYEGQQRPVVAPVASGFPERTEEQLVEIISTGSESYDSVLADLLSRVSVVDVYDRYFRTHDGLAIEHVGSHPHVRFGVSAVDANELTIVHLLSRGLLENPHEGSGQSLLEYRGTLTGYIEATGMALCLVLKSWDRHQQLGQLIVRQVDSRPSTEKVVYVFGPVYQQFLEKNGDAEAIIGAVVSNQRQLKYLPEFVDALPKLKLAYSNWLAREDNARLADSGKIIRNAVADAMVTQINSLSDVDNVCGCDKAQMHRVSAETIAAIPETEWRQSPYQAIRIVVCRSMFPTSNAFKLLTLMDELTQKHGYEDARVAAYHAIKTLLVEHFLSQVVKVG